MIKNFTKFTPYPLLIFVNIVYYPEYILLYKKFYPHSGEGIIQGLYTREWEFWGGLLEFCLL